MVECPDSLPANLFSDIQEESFYTHGAVLCFYGVDKDRWTANDLAGRAFLHLARIPEIEWSSDKDGMEYVETLTLQMSIQDASDSGPFKVSSKQSSASPNALS